MDLNTILSLSILGAAVSALTAAVKAVVGRDAIGRLLPLLPLLLGALGSILVPSLSPGSSLGEHVVYGVLTGAFSGQLYESVKRQFEKALPPGQQERAGSPDGSA